MDPVERRLIPACAGKTLQQPIAPMETPAHPRVCGENARLLPRGQYARGSSPRVRGKRIQNRLG